MWICKKFTRRTLFHCTVRQLKYDNLTFGNYSGDPNNGYFFVNFCSSSLFLKNLNTCYRTILSGHIAFTQLDLKAQANSL